MFFKDWFYRSFPSEWRFNMAALHFIAIAFYLFMIVSWACFEEIESSTFLSVGIGLIAIVHIVRAAVVEGNTDLEKSPAYDSRSGLWSVLTLGLCMLLFCGSLFAEEVEKANRRADQAWILSEFCSENGKYRSDRVRECASLSGAARVGLCKLGASPMNDCEIALRKRLNKPIPVES